MLSGRLCRKDVSEICGVLSDRKGKKLMCKIEVMSGRQGRKND